MKYRLGCKPDVPDPRDRHFARLGLATAVPPAFSLQDKVVEVLDQTVTSRCVAHAWAQALRITDLVEGVQNPPLPSRDFIYYGACKFDGELVVVDEGTQLRSGAQAIVKFGRPPESAWPFNPSPTISQPSWEAFREAYDYRGPAGYYRLSGTDQMKQALAASKPWVGGVQVGRSIMDYEGGIYDPDPHETKIGGHALCGVGYAPDHMLIVGSWGGGYGERGFMRVSYRFAASFTDCWAVH
jgi:hypothetical protein